MKVSKTEELIVGRVEHWVRGDSWVFISALRDRALSEGKQNKLSPHRFRLIH